MESNTRAGRYTTGVLTPGLHSDSGPSLDHIVFGETEVLLDNDRSWSYAVPDFDTTELPHTFTIRPDESERFCSRVLLRIPKNAVYAVFSVDGATPPNDACRRHAPISERSATAIPMVPSII